MKTLIVSTLIFFGFGFSAEGQEIVLELCKDCSSHLLKVATDNNIECVESSGQPLMLGGGFITNSGIKLNESPSIEAMETELRSVATSIFPLDLTAVEVLKVEKANWPNSYHVHCRNKGLNGIIKVNLIDTSLAAEEIVESIHKLQLIISICEGPAIQKTEGFECEEGPMSITLDELNATFTVEDSKELSLEQLQYLVNTSEKMKGEITKFEALSAYVYKLFLKVGDKQTFYFLTVFPD